MNKIEFCVSTMGGTGKESPRMIKEMLDANDLEGYIAKVVGGLVHQGVCQTGHERPIGETTATRIAHEILSLLNYCGRDVSSFDFLKFHNLLNLDKYAR